MDIQSINASMATNIQAPSVKQQRVSLEQKPDSYSFSSKLCNENMSRNDIKGDGLFAPVIGYSYSGFINNKQSYFEESKPSSGLIPTNEPTDIIGSIDNKTIELTKTKHRISLTESIINHKGTYDGNDFDLNYTPSSFMVTPTITGTINGEEVEFTFPGSKVPSDEATKDLLTSILMLNGCKATSKGGEFKKLVNSDWQQRIVDRQNQEAMDYMMAQQMGMI